MDLRLKPLCFALLLLAGNATAGSGCADDASYGAGCGGGYPQPQEYGTRTDVYLTNDGRIGQINQHLSSDEDDEVRFYGTGGYVYGADEFDEFDEFDDE